jgi:hypothetical protein
MSNLAYAVIQTACVQGFMVPFSVWKPPTQHEGVSLVSNTLFNNPPVFSKILAATLTLNWVRSLY